MKKQGYNSRLDETLGAKDGKESSKQQSMASRRHESEGMEKKDHGHKYGSDSKMSYRNKSEENHGYYSSVGKVLQHMTTNKMNFDSSTDRGIATLYTGERKGE